MFWCKMRIKQLRHSELANAALDCQRLGRESGDVEML